MKAQHISIDEIKTIVNNGGANLTKVHLDVLFNKIEMQKEALKLIKSIASDSVDKKLQMIEKTVTLVE